MTTTVIEGWYTITRYTAHQYQLFIGTTRTKLSERPMGTCDEAKAAKFAKKFGHELPPLAIGESFKIEDIKFNRELMPDSILIHQEHHYDLHCIGHDAYILEEADGLPIMTPWTRSLLSAMLEKFGVAMPELEVGQTTKIRTL